MSRHQFVRLAIGIALCAGLAGPTIAQAGGLQPSQPTPALAPANPCPAGYVVDGPVTTVSKGGKQFTCKPAQHRFQCGPGTEYFQGGCNFGCREKLVIK
jgi:hypothetical protein